jgi:hypothetical protein
MKTGWRTCASPKRSKALRDTLLLSKPWRAADLAKATCHDHNSCAAFYRMWLRRITGQVCSGLIRSCPIVARKAA